jgi:REP element-mobilizing transposase RayT
MGVSQKGRGRGPGWYHFYTSVHHGRGKDFSLVDGDRSGSFLALLQDLSTVYLCNVVGFSLMPRHFHLVLHAPPAHHLWRFQIQRRARRLLLGREREVKRWGQAEWNAMKNRLFSVASFVRQLEAESTRWIQGEGGACGPLWNGHFRGELLADRASVLSCLMYVDLDPVRNGMVTYPERYQHSSIALRESGRAEWLLPLSELMGAHGCDALSEYRISLYCRGGVPFH